MQQQLYKTMSLNSFDYYQQLRQYQLHINKLSNPQSQVPGHTAFKPPKPQLERVRQYERNKRIEQIEHQNEHIMHKLVNINKRRSEISQSSPNLSLPRLKKHFTIPLYQQQNNQIAKKIIQSKSRISSLGDLHRNKSLQARKKSISKYYNQDGVVINRKKYLAELMLLKKMRVSQVMKNSRC